MREGEVELAALAGLAFDPDLPVLHLYQLLADSEAQACSFANANGGKAYLVELVEDTGAFFGGNAEAGVGDGDANGVVLNYRVYIDFAAGFGELCAVAEEVVGFGGASWGLPGR